jgi:hypothetical protein
MFLQYLPRLTSPFSPFGESRGVQSLLAGDTKGDTPLVFFHSLNSSPLLGYKNSFPMQRSTAFGNSANEMAPEHNFSNEFKVIEC